MTRKDFEQTVRFTVGRGHDVFEYVPDQKPISGIGCISRNQYYVCNVSKMTATGLHWYNFTFYKKNGGILKFAELTKIEQP